MVLHVLSVVPIQAEVELEIGPDTTVIDGPLNEDGTINYLAYLNEKLSEGVTAENNFAVDVAKSMPANAWPGEAFRLKVFEKLGIDPTEQVVQFISYPDYLASLGIEQDAQEVWDVKTETIQRPWNGEYDLVKQWLDSQVEAIDLLTAQMHKGEFYFPLISEEGKPEALLSCPFPWMRYERGIAWALAARAQWHIGEGDLDAAWRDVMQLNHFSRVVMEQGLVIDLLVGFSVDQLAMNVVPQVASSEKLTPDSARRMIKDLLDTEPALRIIDLFEVDYRLGSLSAVQDVWKGRFVNPLEIEYFDPRLYELVASKDYDPNVSLKVVNRYMDDLYKALRIPDFLQRRQAMIKYDEKIEALGVEAGKILDMDEDLTVATEQLIAESNVVTAAATFFMLSPKFNFATAKGVNDVEARVQMRRDLAPVALALGGYHAEHGKYPADLNALVPGYLEKLPVDFATGRLPVYRVEDGVAVVYSLGADLDDDGGVEGNTEDGDIVVRVDRR